MDFSAGRSANTELAWGDVRWLVEDPPSSGSVKGFTDRAFNLTLALILLPPAVLVLGGLYLFYLTCVRRDGPFLYRGTRLGRNKTPFTIYKIRTLKANAEEQIGAELYTADRGLHTWYGDFLRTVRLDELPQLFNIIRGDMDFVGPRPIRPVVYEDKLCTIPGYDQRFSVRPGLTGISQLYTPHSAPKRMRSLLDNRFLRANPGFLTKLILIGQTALRFAWNMGKEVALICITRIKLILRGGSLRERRLERRRRIHHAICEIVDPGGDGGPPVRAQLFDIGEKSLCVRLPPGIVNGHRFDFCLMHRHGLLRRRRSRIYCDGICRHDEESEERGDVTVIEYMPKSEFNQYKIEKYVIRTSFG